ncbi:hypothetical protein NpPPO83_00012681 [Neofusicoccum parvum]|uniref:Uncharacterized protein n=1 Tax=Neofusicoccum parvum TaxID=310453 RepID=A0ACB5SNQ6_9PEZI|nr:hypothetical protein NpPPO83_00012681 [Neofusicoccum parvum]
MSSNTPTRTITQEEELELLYAELEALRARNDALLARANAAEAETARLRRFVERTIRSFLTHTFYAQGIAREAGDGLGPGGRQLKFRIRSWGEQKQRWTERRMEAFLAGDWE